MSAGRDHEVLDFVANALVAAGWLVLGLGGLCTVFMGLLIGDSWHRPHLMDWLTPAIMLGVGGGLMWGGRRLRKFPRRRFDGADASD